MVNFAFDLNHREQVMNIKVEGMFTPQDAEAYICEYKNNVSQIDTKKFEMICDASKLKCTSPEVLPLLENSMYLYKNAGFKKVKVDMGKNKSIVKFQLIRAADRIGFTNCEIF